MRLVAIRRWRSAFVALAVCGLVIFVERSPAQINPQAAQVASRELTDHVRSVRAIKYSPAGTLLAASGEDRSIKIWNCETGKLEREILGSKAPYQTLCFSDDGESLAGIQIWPSGAPRIGRWNVATGKAEKPIVTQASNLRTLVFPAGNGRLISGSSGLAPGEAHPENAIRMWELCDDARSEPIKCDSGVLSLARSPVQHEVFAAHEDGVIRRWNLRNKAVEKSYDRIDKRDIPTSVAASRRGSLVAGSFADGTVCVWDAQSGESVMSVRPDWRVQAIVFHPECELLAVAEASSRVSVWDIRKQAKQREYSHNHGWTYAIDFRPDGKQLAAGVFDGVVMLWECADLCQDRQSASGFGDSDVSNDHVNSFTRIDPKSLVAAKLRKE